MFHWHKYLMLNYYKILVHTYVRTFALGLQLKLKGMTLE
jgi:hypothetical protein